MTDNLKVKANKGVKDCHIAAHSVADNVKTGDPGPSLEIQSSTLRIGTARLLLPSTRRRLHAPSAENQHFMQNSQITMKPELNVRHAVFLWG